MQLAIKTGDPLTTEGAIAYLRTRSEVSILPEDHWHEAEVLLILIPRVTDETLVWMQLAVDAAGGRELRFVLVGDGVRDHHVRRATGLGLVSVLPHQGTDFDRIVRAVTEVREGRLELPEGALGWLAGQLRAIHRDVLGPRGLHDSGLSVREVDVLRLLADGLDSLEIAQQLNYSERTVKHIISGLLTRLDLRNRSHAVAFALRNGVL